MHGSSRRGYNPRTMEGTLRRGARAFISSWWVLAVICPCLVGCAKRRVSVASDFQSADPAIRAAAAWQAGERRVGDATRELIERLEDEDPVVRMAAHESLRKLSGEDFGYRSWAPPAEQERAVARWRAWANEHRNDAPRLAAGSSDIKHAGSSEKAATGQGRSATGESAPDETNGRTPSPGAKVELDPGR